MGYDLAGNLESRRRQQLFIDAQESFCYDGLNRLTHTHTGTLSGSCGSPPSVRYDGYGNITRKDGQAYTYGQGTAGPHAVTRVGSTTYSYDANGNVSRGDGRNLQYSVADQATRITRGGDTLTFRYGIDRQRYYRKDVVDGVTTETWYQGSAERIVRNGVTTMRRHITGEVVVEHKLGSAGNITASTTHYQLLDHLGSILAVYDASGTTTENHSFNAWGQRRDLASLNALPDYSGVTSVITRGYTGHEHADRFRVIHMNGRIYDPHLGRFLQADPYVQFRNSTQSYNRYSYVLNNPLRYTDPSGYFLKKLFKNKAFRVVAAAVASYFTYGWASGFFDAAFASSGLFTTTVGASSGTLTAGAASFSLAGSTVVSGVAVGAFSGAAAGFVGGTIMTGSFKGGVKSAFSGALFGGIGGHFGSTWNSKRVAANSLAGGVSSKVAGGKFADGFKFALATSLVRVSWEKMRLTTNRLKTLACSQDGGTECVYNSKGELMTYSNRNPQQIPGTNPGQENWFTRLTEGSPMEGFAFRNKSGLWARGMNHISKAHDWWNSNLSRHFGFEGYDPHTGFVLQGGEVYNTAFQAWSLGGMLPAAAVTGVAVSASTPYLYPGIYDD